MLSKLSPAYNIILYIYYNNYIYYLTTVCSLGEVKKSKPEKYTNKQVVKVCFVNNVTLYWDF